MEVKSHGLNTRYRLRFQRYNNPADQKAPGDWHSDAIDAVPCWLCVWCTGWEHRRSCFWQTLSSPPSPRDALANAAAASRAVLTASKEYITASGPHSRLALDHS